MHGRLKEEKTRDGDEQQKLLSSFLFRCRLNLY